MGWQHDLEQLRDYGLTWGPGHEKEDYMDDSAETPYDPNPFRALQVDAHEKYKTAGEALRAKIPSMEDVRTGKAAYNWLETLSNEGLELCREAALDLGYILQYPDAETKWGDLWLSIEHTGYMPGHGGNVHCYVIPDIQNPNDLLQLVADFVAIGKTPTTYFKDRAITLNSTGELRYSLEKYGLSFPAPQNKQTESIDVFVEAAQKKQAPDKIQKPAPIIQPER